MEKYEVNSYDISENLKNEIRDDVKSPDSGLELRIEDEVMKELSSLKGELGFEQQTIDTMYHKEYKNFLKLHSWSLGSLPFKRLQDIKESILLRDIIANESLYSSGNKFMNIVYKIYSIDLDLTKNSKIQNVIKGMLDEIFSTPKMMVDICKAPANFMKNFITFFKNINIEKLESYWDSCGYDILSIDLSSISGQYNFGKRIVSIATTILSGVEKGVSIAAKTGNDLASSIFNEIVTQSMKSTWDVQGFVLGAAKDAAQGNVGNSEVRIERSSGTR